MAEEDEYIITGYEAYYVLTNGEHKNEYFSALNMEQAVNEIKSVLSNPSAAAVREIYEKEECILLPISSIVYSIVRPRYQVENGPMGQQRVKKSAQEPPA